MGVLAAVSSSSATVACDSTASVGQYVYVWKTDKAWAGTCRQLVVKLADGTEHRASFNLK